MDSQSHIVARRQPAEPLPDSSRPLSRRRRIWRNFWRIVVVMLVLMLGAGVAYGAYIGSIVAKISTNPWSFEGLAADTTGRTNLLILGVGDPGHAGQNLTDTIMMVSFSQPDERVAQISIPRDLRVSIPGYGTAKINAANADGGTALAGEVVSNVTGQAIDYTVTTDFSGLKLVVDELGGLDIQVTDELKDTEYPCDDDQYKVCGLDIKPGLQHMNGSQVLAYTRCRKGTCGNDYGRAARQQVVLGLLGAKLFQPALLWQPARMTAMATAIRQAISTDMSAWQMVQLAIRWHDYNTKQAPARLVLTTGSDGLLVDAPGSSDLLPAAGDFRVIQQRIQEIFAH